MKNLSYLIIVILISIIIFLKPWEQKKIFLSFSESNIAIPKSIIDSIKNKSKNYQPTKQDIFNILINDKDLQGINLLQNFKNINDIGEDILQPKAKEMIEYANPDPSKSRSIYFRFKPIYDRIQEIINKNLMKLPATQQDKIENYGLRIYFGKYNDINVPIDRPDFKQRNTVIIALTHDQIFSDDNDKYGDGRNIIDLVPNITVNTLRNVGGLCPPNCPGNMLDHDKFLYDIK